MATQKTWTKEDRATVDCIHCEKTVKRLREGQRFCSTGCRVAYHRYRDDEMTIRRTYAEWLELIEKTGTAHPLTRDQFRGKIVAQLAKLPLWAPKTPTEAAKHADDPRYEPLQRVL